MAKSKVFLVSDSIEELRSWDASKKGYRQLGGFSIFVIIYLVLLALQLRVGFGAEIDTALRSQLSANLPSIAIQNDFWKYVNNTVMPMLFQTTWYNGNNLAVKDQGYVLSYNKLVGGVLLLQKRGTVQQDGCDNLNGKSAYSSFYPSCYLDSEDQSSFANLEGRNPSNLTLSSFSYDSKFTNGFASFFGLAENQATHIAKVNELVAQRWTDKSTRSLQVKFAIYNANLASFSFCRLDFVFERGGIFTNNNHLTIASFNMEPYRSGVDYVKLVLELIIMIWISNQFAECALNFLIKFREHFWIEKKTVFPFHLFDLWFCVDITHFILFFCYIIYRVSVLWLIYKNPIVVPTNLYQPVLEDIASLQQHQLLVNFLSILVVMFRLFKYYRFQARLNILNKTFANARADLYHFVIVFFLVFACFGFLAHIQFGESVPGFSSYGRALMGMWIMIFGGFDYPSMDMVNPALATIFFIAFNVFVTIILLNVLIAIIVDAYVKAVEESKTHGRDPSSIFDDAIKGVVKGMNATKEETRFLTDDALVAAFVELQKIKRERVPASELVEAIDVVWGLKVNERTLRRMPGLVQDFASDAPEAPPPVQAYPLEVISKIETVLRENSILRQRLAAVDGKANAKAKSPRQRSKAARE